MSRIGKKLISVPDKVEIKISPLNVIDVKGPKGTVSFKFDPSVKVEKKDNTLIVIGDDNQRSLWGLTRTILGNMVKGVTTGFVKTLEFNGVGYKAAVSGPKLTLNLGFSHPIDYSLPKGIEAKVIKNTIEIHGNDKELVGFVAAKIRAFRPPEPYKGKGLKYSDEKIIRKAGKTGAKK